MRGFYATIKVVTFCWLFLILPLPETYPDFWQAWNTPMQFVATALVWATVFVCIVRGLPVVIEARVFI